jgi:hypothetical protein
LSDQVQIKRALKERIAFRLYAYVMKKPTLYNLGMRVARLLQRAVVRRGRIGDTSPFLGDIVPPLSAWTAWRDGRPIAPRSFREQWRDGLAYETKEELQTGDERR